MNTGYSLETNGGVATLTIDRPEKRNALDVPLIEDLLRVVTALGEDSEVRVLIITGGGEKSFVAGADINDMVVYDPEQARYHINIGHKLFTAIEDLPFPTIAGINGYCLGGGLELAMACDIRVTSSNARFGQPEITIGMPCGWGGTARLQRLIGQSRTKYLTLSGKMISADEALTCGLVSEVFESVAEMREGAAALGQRISSFSPIVARTTKFMVRDAEGRSAREVAQRDESIFAYLFTTHDSREGLRAFLEKRPAEYKGV